MNKSDEYDKISTMVSGISEKLREAY